MSADPFSILASGLTGAITGGIGGVAREVRPEVQRVADELDSASRGGRPAEHVEAAAAAPKAPLPPVHRLFRPMGRFREALHKDEDHTVRNLAIGGGALAIVLGIGFVVFRR